MFFTVLSQLFGGDAVLGSMKFCVRMLSALLVVGFFGIQYATAEKLPESWVEEGPSSIKKNKFVPSDKAPLISMGEDGNLVYSAYSELGDRLLDWSYCGYMKSEVPIPMVPVVETLEPIGGDVEPDGDMAYPSGPDSQKRIQEALDKVGSKKTDEDGFRGAVLLKRGIYFLDGGLNIPPGVVLRGEGDGLNGTVLIVNSSDDGGSMIRIGESGAKAQSSGSTERIIEPYVPAGSYKITVDNAASFDVGDFVNVRKTTNQQWIDDLGMGERLRHIRGGKEGLKKNPWKPKSYQFSHIRQITDIDGDTITLDVMLPQSISSEHGGGEVQKVNIDSYATQSGIEFLGLVSNYDTSVEDTGKGANFVNYKSGIVVSGAENSWVRNCTVLHVSFAAVSVGDNTRHITVRDSKNLAPVGPKRGGNRYAFSIGGGTLHLFYNCYSEDGRHDFVGGSRTMGPFAFVNCTAVRGGQSEPHHRWGTGFLFDSVTTEDGSLAAINRGDSGTGHGWAASNALFWNSNAKNVVVFDPETVGENNFAIGYTGSTESSYSTDGLRYANDRSGYWETPQEGKYYGFALMGSGHIESPDGPVEPASLFEQQLIDRIGEERAMEVLK